MVMKFESDSYALITFFIRKLHVSASLEYHSSSQYQIFFRKEEGEEFINCDHNVFSFSVLFQCLGIMSKTEDVPNMLISDMRTEIPFVYKGQPMRRRLYGRE